MSNCNGYTKFGSDFRCFAGFLVCNIRNNTFSERNTPSRYHMIREFILTKVSIFIGISIGHSIVIKVNSFGDPEVEGK